MLLSGRTEKSVRSKRQVSDREFRPESVVFDRTKWSPTGCNLGIVVGVSFWATTRWSLEEVLNMPDLFDSRSQLFFYLSSYRFRTEIFPFFCFVLILDYQMLFCYIVSFNILVHLCYLSNIRYNVVCREGDQSNCFYKYPFVKKKLK